MQHQRTERRGARAIRILAAAILCSVIGGAGPALAAICPGSNIPYGGCFLQLRTHSGELPYAITVATSESKVIVADLYSGLFFKYPQLGISGGTPLTFFSPLGQAAAYVGLGYHPGEDALYWLAEDSGGTMLLKSGLTGSLISTVDLVVPNGGSLSSLTWNPETGTFWTMDIVNDVARSLTTAGVFTGATIASPGVPQPPIGGPAFGLSLTVAPNTFSPGQYFLDMAYGFPSDLRASAVTRLTSAGTTHGLFYDLSTANEASGWVTGIAWAAAGSNGQAVTFILDLTGNRIVEVPTPAVNARSVLNLTCTANAVNDVVLTWTNPIPYNSISVLRDGAVIGSLGGAVTTFTDLDLDGATYTYQVKPIPAGSTNLPAAKCSVVVGFGRKMNVAAHVGLDPFAVTVIESTDQVLVADLELGGAHLYSKSLVPAGASVTSPFAAGITSGVAWDPTDNSLLWHDGEAGTIRRTSLAGAPLGPVISLSPSPGGLTGDISYSPLTDTYFGVNLTLEEYFEFGEDGTMLGTCPFPVIGTAQGDHGQGVAVVADPNNVMLDVPTGPASGGKVDRVMRLLECADSGLEYGVTPTTLSGDLAGIAWTAEGSNGLPAEYLVGYDTGAIYEVTLDLSSLGDDFRRGDVNVDGVRDISDATSMLLFLFPPNSMVLGCFDSADVNDNGALEIGDVIALLNFLFVGGSNMPAPGTCGPDPTLDALICNSDPSCP